MAETELMTIEEAARYLKVCRKTLYRWLRDGRPQGYRVGRQWRLKKAHLDRWLEENRAGVDEEALEGLEEVRVRLQRAAGRLFSAEEIVAMIDRIRERRMDGVR